MTVYRLDSHSDDYTFEANLKSKESSLPIITSDIGVGMDSSEEEDLRPIVRHTTTRERETTSIPSSQNDEAHMNASGDGTNEDDQLLHGFELIACCIALVICMFLVALDQTIIATFLPEVGAKFNAFSKVSWIATGFLLPVCVFSLSWGNLGIIFGRKYALLTGIILFEAGSLVCALADSMNMLIGGRVLAGVGGSGVQLLVMLIISEIVRLEKRGFMSSLMSLAFAIASVIGPLVGGAFTSYVSWRWCFYINLPFGGIAFAAIYWLFKPPFPEGTTKEKLLRIDYTGLSILTIGLVLLLLALTMGSSTDPWNSAIVISFFIIGGLLSFAFFAHTFLLSKVPMIPLELCKKWTIVAPCFAYFFLFGAFISTMIFLTSFFQIVLGQGAIESGVTLLPFIVPNVVFSIVGGVLVQKTRRTKEYAIFGMAVAAVGFGLISTLSQDTSKARRVGYLILTGFALGFVYNSVIVNCQVATPKKNGGHLIIASMMGFARALGGVVGTTVGQTIQTVVFRAKVQRTLVALNISSKTLIA